MAQWNADTIDSFVHKRCEDSDIRIYIRERYALVTIMRTTRPAGCIFGTRTHHEGIVQCEQVDLV